MNDDIDERAARAIRIALRVIGIVLAFVIAWCILIVACPRSRGADKAYPVTGTTMSHGLAWVPGPGPLPTYFTLESTPIFGPVSWTRLGDVQTVSTCLTRTNRLGITSTACRFGAGDRTARYRVRPGPPGSKDGIPVPADTTEEDNLLRCCRIGEFDTLCFAGLATVPPDCH